MIPLIRLTAIAAPLPVANVDTDQIFPARYMSRSRGSSGFGDLLFRDYRFAADGAIRPDFILNQPAYGGAQILVAGPNFACGSAREQSVHALLDYGFRVVIATSLGDIFASSAPENGLLAVAVGPEIAAEIQQRLLAGPGLSMTVDLDARRIEMPGLAPIPFAVSERRRDMLMQGLDPLRQLLKLEPRIAAFEAAHEPLLPI
jgi:3-isopropylmalate/(R)-2-methylmalate dehydratase small subunit